jgi:hypothetical protein
MAIAEKENVFMLGVLLSRICAFTGTSLSSQSTL